MQEIENIIVTKLGINDEAIIRLFVQPTTYCIDQLIEIIHLLNTDIVQHFLITNYKKNKLCNLSEKLRHIDEFFDLTLILQLLNDSEKEILIKQLGPDNLEKYIETSEKLIAVIQVFPKEKQISALDYIGKKRLFHLIEHKEMLTQILRSEAQKDVKHYILLLYDKQKIVKFIQDMSSLLLVLESLSKEEQIDLFGDHALQAKIQGFEFNAKLFKVIASELLLKITMEIIGFDKILSNVKDDCDLIYLCKSIPGEFFDYFISKILNSDNATNLITNSQTIISLCKLVPLRNLSNFINTYLITYIHKVVLDCNDFKAIYALIPTVDLEIFLTKVLIKEYYQKLIFKFYDIVAIFQTLKNMPTFINKLIEENPEIIKREIKNHHLLLSLLSSINEENRLFLLKK